ncbi:D-glycero-beta-D-manno-heptose-7-phosphate kinase [Cohaesibacter haloalkalitolerans]|uniref:D-glycero-beta-D-manno-heptose-7-phosphate kinase n=1 Tax=Cohaesibacter haloalkalitolerans TaxID=1162980 RepID=UPI000E64C0C4|nr:D-glycero-beta-D-manno-heptose-7-phosphate kinase [Cohaesibacter haloalkalitolerans]
MISLDTAIDAFETLRLLVIGDVMLDRFIYGEVRRVSPEAPVPIISMDNQQERAGGAANVAQNIAALGAICDLIGVVGDDEAAENLSGLLAANPAIRAHLIRDPQRRTTLKMRFVATLHSTHLLRADSEDVHSITPELEDLVIEAARKSLPMADAVVLSDYAKGVLGDRVLQTVIADARGLGKPVIVDPKSAVFARYAGASVLTPNMGELMAAAQVPALQDEASIVSAAQRLIREADSEALLVTCGAHGVTVVTREGKFASYPAEASRVADVSGAGDTVAATFSLALAAGAGFFHSTRLANAAAGIAVGKPSTGEVTANELRAAFLQRPHIDIAASILTDASHAQTVVRAWQEKGMVVGFTNGCFDLLHEGHIALLATARAQCDRLIVGLNSDASVSRLKGPKRPIQSGSARAAVLAALQMVDAVVLFEEDTPLSLITRLAPDMLFKGADYRLEDVVGREVVEARGGRVCLIDLLPEVSTTGIIASISAAQSSENG